MKVPFMRWVDFWAGVPVCFILSVLSFIGKLLRTRRPGERFKPRRILFIELSEMGSTILAYGAMKKAKERLGAEVFFLIFQENAESVRLLDIVPEANVLTIRSRSIWTFLADTLAVVLKMRSLEIDAVIDLELFSRFPSILCWLSGAKAIVGFYRYEMEGLYRGTFQTYRVSYNPYYHISRNFVALVDALEAEPGGEPLLKKEVDTADTACAKLVSAADERKSILAKLRQHNPAIREGSKLVLLNPGASQFLPIRKWPVESYSELVRHILALPDAFVVIIGVRSDSIEAKAICRAIGDPRCVDFTGQTANLKELVDLFNVATALVTNDSGPAHFASLTDIRNVVLFGPETPVLYGPLGEHCVCLYAGLACSPCVSAYNHRKTRCTDNQCLKQITPAQVLEALRPSLSEK
jgi:ADP-heptose:LPS heptosyltransferase